MDIIHVPPLFSQVKNDQIFLIFEGRCYLVSKIGQQYYLFGSQYVWSFLCCQCCFLVYATSLRESLEICRHISHYIKGTTNFGIKYFRSSYLLVGFSDSDQAGDGDDLKSTSSYVFCLCSEPLVLLCNKQWVLSLLKMEVEYRGSMSDGKMVIWLRHLLGELGFLVKASPIIYCDNQSAIQVIDNHVAHSKMKNIELHVHYLRQLVHEHIVSSLYCRIDDQFADMLTKSLSKSMFIRF